MFFLWAFYNKKRSFTMSIYAKWRPDYVSVNWQVHMQKLSCLSYLLSTNDFIVTWFFSTQSQFWLTFSWIELQILLSCCLIRISIVILRQIFYLVNWCPCLGLGPYISSICDLFFIFSLKFIVINHITSFTQTYLIFVCFLEYLLLAFDDEVDEKGE